MLKKLLVIFTAILILPVYAGEFEDAYARGDNIFLYLYTPECGYCTRFTPRYNKLSKMYDSKYKFIKVDASTGYGYSLFKKYNGRYVPYVLLINSKKNITKQIPSSCLSEPVCAEHALINFLK